MKYLILSVFCIVAIAAAIPVDEDLKTLDESKELAANNKECIERTGVTLGQIDELQKNPTGEKTKPAMCYIQCMIELGGVEKDGIIQKDVAVSKRPEGVGKEDAEKLIEECSKLDADDSCERSFKRYVCVFEKSEKKDWLKTE